MTTTSSASYRSISANPGALPAAAAESALLNFENMTERRELSRRSLSMFFVIEPHAGIFSGVQMADGVIFVYDRFTAGRSGENTARDNIISVRAGPSGHIGYPHCVSTPRRGPSQRILQSSCFGLPFDSNRSGIFFYNTTNCGAYPEYFCSPGLYKPRWSLFVICVEGGCPRVLFYLISSYTVI